MVEMLLLLSLLVVFIFLNKDRFKSLSNIQIVGIIFSLIVITLGATFCIYVGGNWLKRLMPNEFLGQSIFVIIIIVVISIGRILWNKIINKIIHGTEETS